VRGKSGHVPFWPGGLDDVLPILDLDRLGVKGLRIVPPGFLRGLRLPGEEIEDQTLKDLDGVEVPPIDEQYDEVGQNTRVIRLLTWFLGN
jgi:hypothetical protein